MANLVDILFERIADEHQCADLALLCLVASVLQHLADLGATAEAVDTRHHLEQRSGVSIPLGGFAFAEAAIEHQLNGQTADLSRLPKHLGLQVHGAVPGGLPAGRRIQSENQPPNRARHRFRRGVELGDEGIHIAATADARGGASTGAFVDLAGHTGQFGDKSPELPAKLPEELPKELSEGMARAFGL